MKYPHPKVYIPVRRFVAPLIAAAVTTALFSCDSPLRTNDSMGESDHYSQSLLYRAILQAERSSPSVGSATLDMGIREARVDSQGPTTLPVDYPVGATRPSMDTVSNIGLRPATLGMPEPQVTMSLQDAISRTVKHSLAIKLEAYNPAIKQQQVIEAQAAFDPILFGQSLWTSTDEPPLTNTNIGFNNGTSWQNQIGIRKMLPTGGQVQASTSVTYRDIDTSLLPASSISTLGTFKTNYITNFNLSITQPLLRGFGSDVAQVNIYLAQRDARISLSDFKKAAIKAVADVEEAYWQLVETRTQVEILERLLIATEQTYNIINVRPDADDASKNQALAAYWERRTGLTDAQKSYRDASDHLKSLLNDPEVDIRSNILINPTDKPPVEPFHFNIADEIETALRQRPEMQASRLLVEKADMVVKVTRNDLLPKLDLTAGMQPNALQNGFEQAFTALVDPMNNIDWNAGVKLEMPLGNREAEARLTRRQYERKQLLDTMVQNALTVVNDVKTQLREVLVNYQKIRDNDEWRKAAANEFQALVQQEEIRAKTPERLQLLLDSQARLAAAEQALVDAIISYNLAIMRLEGAKGTLLEFNRISLDHPPREGSDAGLMRIMGESDPYKPIFPLK